VCRLFHYIGVTSQERFRGLVRWCVTFVSRGVKVRSVRRNFVEFFGRSCGDVATLSTVVSRYRILRIDAGAAVVYNEQRRCNAVETYVRGGVRMVLVRVRETDCGRWV
jgi:hypothetical protein